jgi:hypothetical protein
VTYEPETNGLSHNTTGLRTNALVALIFVLGAKERYVEELNYICDSGQ